jgi:hypothetical protein
MAVGPEISEMRILGSVAQSAALGAAIIGLSSIPSTHAAWKIDPPKDDPAATHDSKRGFLTAKAGDRQSEAVLEITCARGGQQLFVSTSTDLRDTIEVRYRIDDRPQKQSVLIFMTRTAFQSAIHCQPRSVLQSVLGLNSYETRHPAYFLISIRPVRTAL